VHDKAEEHSSQLLSRVTLKSRVFFFVVHVLGHLAYFTTEIFFRDCDFRQGREAEQLYFASRPGIGLHHRMQTNSVAFPPSYLISAGGFLFRG
jgi:hypothetical protein